MKQLLVTFLILLSFSTPAAAETTDAELQALLLRAQQALNNPGSGADREAAAAGLIHTIRALEQQSAAPAHPRHHRRGHNSNACIDLGSRVYGEIYTETAAVEQAIAKCKERVDDELLMIVFEANQKTYTANYAFERAVETAKRPELFGKAALIRFATEVYSKTYTELSAVDYAIKLIEGVPRSATSCIDRLYAVNVKVYTANSALEYAVKKCTE